MDANNNAKRFFQFRVPEIRAFKQTNKLLTQHFKIDLETVQIMFN